MKDPFFTILNNFFDHIYVISLKRSVARHRLLRENLKGLQYSLFWGADGKKIDVEKLVEDKLYHPGISQLLYKRDGRRINSMTTSKIGCALSKNMVYKDILEKNFKKVLILEDDVLFDKEKHEILQCSLGELPSNWDLLFFGYWSYTNPITLKEKIKMSFLIKLSRFLMKYDADDIRKRYPRKFSEHLDKSGRHYGTHAYAVSNMGAKKLLNYSDPVTQFGDNILGELCNYEWLKAFNLKIPVAYQNRYLESTITSRTQMMDLPPSVIKRNKITF